MQYYPDPLRRLIRSLAKLPGIGEKTAERLALHILRSSLSEAEELAGSIVSVKQNVRLCDRCYGLSDAEQCHICRDPSRNASLLCVVEQPADMVAIEKSGAFKGLYHILGGALSPMDGVGPHNIRISELLGRAVQEGIQEIVLATGTSVEGEATAAYIAQQLKDLPIRISRIASGVPVGGDLKYIDQMTLRCALDGRRHVR